MKRSLIKKISFQCGISLIEVLVVLIILGLVSTLAINGGSNALLMKQKLQNAANKSVNDSVVNNWFRKTIAAAYPVPENAPTFSNSQIRLLTQNPLIDPDSNAQISWSLTIDDRYVVLNYEEGDNTFEVRRWFDAEASFEYAFEDNEHIFPSIITLEVDYLAPFGRKNEKILVSYLGLKTYPLDFRQLR